MIRRPTVRAGFTLLEIILATSLAALLLGGLYVAMQVQLRSAQEAREAVEQGTLVRSLVARLASDIAGNLGAAPRAASSSSGSSSRGSSSGGASSTGATSSSSSETPSSSSFNLGVLGDSTRLVLYVSRPVRPDSLLQTTVVSELAPGMCDLRRITYWMVAGDGAASGLARQEVKQVMTQDAINTIPPDVQNEDSFVIAPEVKNLVFSYFDGTQWLSEWDGAAPGADGTTPLAVAFEMSVAVPGSTTERTIRHVVALQSANGTAQTTDSTSTGGTSSGR